MREGAGREDGRERERGETLSQKALRNDNHNVHVTLAMYSN